MCKCKIKSRLEFSLNASIELRGITVNVSESQIVASDGELGGRLMIADGKDEVDSFVGFISACASAIALGDAAGKNHSLGIRTVDVGA